MKKTLVISLTISIIINAALLIALRPGVHVSDIGVELYSKLADDARGVGYQDGKETATKTAIEAINGDEFSLEMFVLNAEQAIYK